MSMSPEKKITDAGDIDMQEFAFANRGCFTCGWAACFSSEPSESWWQRMRSPENKERWWCRGWMKVREWSEIVAGPKWKTFIRRFNNNNNKNRTNSIVKHGSFNYDPLSYALNFDDGHAREDDLCYGGFSVRFASVSASAKSSMDLGKDAPDFT